MGIPEEQLKTWSRVGASQTSRDTYVSVKKVIESKDSPYAAREHKSFLQGSYGNDTNVYGLDSDVDVVLQCNAMFYYDLAPLSDAEKASFKKVHPNASAYKFADFKKEVGDWLANQFPGHIDPGEKAIRVTASNNRRDADVLPCVEYRRYLKFNGIHDEQHVSGICFFTPDGTQIINYPELHSANMTAKHQANGEWLKPLVRIAKNMRNRLVGDGNLEAGLAPSYYIEGLFYNVPTECFGPTYADSFTKSVNYLLKADRSKFLCANQQFYLLFEGSPVTWRAAKCTTFLEAITKMWNDW